VTCERRVIKVVGGANLLCQSAALWPNTVQTPSNSSVFSNLNCIVARVYTLSSANVERGCASERTSWIFLEMHVVVHVVIGAFLIVQSGEPELLWLSSVCSYRNISEFVHDHFNFGIRILKNPAIWNIKNSKLLTSLTIYLRIVGTYKQHRSLR
jgi:hypothetical protein